MSSATSSHSVAKCLECNAPLSPAETQGLCARCLLKMGLASQFDETSVADAGARRFVPPPMFPFDFGGYRMRRLLGRGGMGAVYEAEQRDTGRPVALKVLGHTIDSPEMRARFMREGRLAASVNHPNSVYIFGTEEIDGAPVIAMELVRGGTLRDLIREGPVPVREAVDAILQIISGLEAAATAGVLHRDVKPANCFVAPDGTVKVGDFGLSVSTLSRHDSQLTASGVMLGTPSFAPPEQLRGDELDVRADIYSVGATLYALLTGRPPHEGDNAVQVVAAVLDKAPEPVAEFRKDVPLGLAQVIARCLAKKRDDRFANYAELREALLPFSACVPEPAPLGLRFIAGLVDWVILMPPNLALTMVLGPGFGVAGQARHSFSILLGFLVYVASCVAYFGFTESRWGASLGKAVCGLRVIGPDGGAPGFWRAATRGAIFIATWELSTILHLLRSARADALLMTELLGALVWALLFVSMRRRNGLAALHELATGTRTVVRAKSSGRVRIDAPLPVAPESVGGERIGPYRVTGSLADGALIVAYDEVLRRHVWIRPCVAGTPPVAASRREIARRSRLRWIAGVRSDAANWDAFEALHGKPLRELSAQSWAAVRGWLHDLAAEIEAASKDGTLPAEISVDHVWITADGRAVLLDVAQAPNPRDRQVARMPDPHAAAATGGTPVGPTGRMPVPHFRCAEAVGAQHFLSAVVDAALDRSALPLHARDFLEKLSAGAFDRVSFILGNLQSILARPATVSRRRRFAALALVPGVALFLSLLMGLILAGVFYEKPPTSSSEREWRELARALELYAEARGRPPVTSIAGMKFIRARRVEPSARVIESLERHLSGHFAALIQKPAFEQEAEAAGIDARRRKLAKAAVAAQPQVTAQQLAEADKALAPAFAMLEGATTGPSPLLVPLIFAGQFVPLIFGGQLLLMGIASLFGGLVFGFAPMLHLFGLAVVTRDGRGASRLRLFARSALVWGPAILGWFVLADLRRLVPEMPSSIGFVLLAISALGFLVGLPWTVLRPNAGPHDRLSGTRVVPR